jgi:predicted GH43/DUF377 family glycosyl hydrolase
LGLASFATRPEFISETVLAQGQTVTPEPKKMAKEFAEQRKAAAPGQWLFYKGNPVLSYGELDQWDDFKVGSPVVLKEGDRYRMWYRGCHFIGDEYTCGIGHAVSQDGILWKKSPQPVFVLEDAVKSERLHTVAVVRAVERYLMWYSMNPDPFDDRSYPTIHLATSTDGLNWKQKGPVLRTLGENTVYIEHAAFYDGKVFHMWYVDIPFHHGADALLHVTSSDGKKWQIAGFTTINTLGVRPARLWVMPDGRGGYRSLFANRREQQKEKGPLGLLVSADGNTWQRHHEGMSAPDGSLKEGVIADAPAVLSEPDGLWMWFVMWQDNGAEEIGVAYKKDGKP